VVDSFSFDKRQNFATRKTVGKDGDYQAYTYNRDDVGNILSIDDDSKFDEIWKGVYEYDDWYRLTKATVGNQAKYIPYAYNDIDNIMRRGSKRYSYDSEKPNAVTKAGSVSFAYDMAGQMTRRGGQTLVWDLFGRLKEARRGDETMARFEYDGSSPDRVVKVEPKSSGWSHIVSSQFELRNGVAVLTPRAGDKRLMRIENPDFQKEVLNDTNGDGVIAVNDVWKSIQSAAEVLEDASAESVLRPLAACAERLLSRSEGMYLHYNHLGSVTVATNGAGEVEGYRSYLPYGAVEESMGDVGPYGFTGQELDEATGLTHFTFRYLDTSVGRWVSPDPLFRVLDKGNVGQHGEATTGYAYVANSPIGSFDPTGLAATPTTKTSTTKTTKTTKTTQKGTTTKTTEAGGMQNTGQIKLKKMGAAKKIGLAILAATGVGAPLAMALAFEPVFQETPGATTEVTTGDTITETSETSSSTTTTEITTTEASPPPDPSPEPAPEVTLPIPPAPKVEVEGPKPETLPKPKPAAVPVAPAPPAEVPTKVPSKPQKSTPKKLSGWKQNNNSGTLNGPAREGSTLRRRQDYDPAASIAASKKKNSKKR
jgi:RHS repeat-associated protein